MSTAYYVPDGLDLNRAVNKTDILLEFTKPMTHLGRHKAPGTQTNKYIITNSKTTHKESETNETSRAESSCWVREG